MLRNGESLTLLADFPGWVYAAGKTLLWLIAALILLIYVLASSLELITHVRAAFRWITTRRTP